MSGSFPASARCCCLRLQQHYLLVCTSSLKATEDPEIAQSLGMKVVQPCPTQLTSFKTFMELYMIGMIGMIGKAECFASYLLVASAVKAPVQKASDLQRLPRFS